MVPDMSSAQPDAIDAYPLSPTQAGMLYHALGDAHTGVDIEQIVITLPEPLDAPRFMQAWQAVAQRHTILRTRFRWEGVDEFRQEVVASADMPLTSVDWSRLESGAVAQHLAQQLASDRAADFDLRRAPAMRLFIAHCGAAGTRVVWTFHHALLDGRSFAPVLHEVFTCYEALQGGRAVQLAAARPYRQYIDWRESLDDSAAQACWRGALAGFHAATPLGLAGAAPNLANEAGGNATFGAHQTRLSLAASAALRSRAAQLGVTVNTLLMAAWAILLHRYSGERDIVFGATRSGRDPGFDADGTLVGLFINTLPVRIQVDGDAELEPWLRALRETMLHMRPFAHTPLVKVQAWSSVARGKPLFDSLVVYDHQSLGSRMRALGGAWAGREVEYIGQTNYPLTVVAYGDDEMIVRLEYSRRFSHSAAERMLGHLTNLLAGIALGQAKQISGLPLLSAAERAALVGQGQAVASFPRGPALHELFERQVRRTPEAIALTAFSAAGERIELSYAELNQRANAVAHTLRAWGVVPNQLVGLRTERNAELVVGLLGILKSGGAYLPLDPVYPSERVAFMLEDARVSVVLTQTSLQAGLTGVTLLCLDEPMPGAAGELVDPAHSSGADDLAYVIYTSGSTGKPKGVRITHHNVCRLFTSTDHWFGFNERDVWTLFHSYAFDFSVWELWGALLHGGRCVVVPLDASRSIDDFLALLVGERVTVLNQTPTAFRRLVDATAEAHAAELADALALRYVIFGGEALELQSLNPWFKRFGDAKPRLINMYGITETTVHVTYRPITRADLAAGAGSVIGQPLADLKLYILDPQGEPAPLGVAGEMFVAGAGVAPGYLNRPELSAQRFVRDAFSADPDARMYRSGDLARRLENGDVEYLGRIDQQVKIRGFRIELGEIEAAIAQHPQVRQVAVIAREDVPGDKRLVAYLVVNGAAGHDGQIADALRRSLRGTLPEYMLPAHFVFLPALPLTQNGKLDRLALPAPAAARSAGSKPFVAPRSGAEQAIAAVWQAVLRVDQVGADDHFFELGGDSILSIQVIARCRQQGLHFTPKDLFNRPTVAELAQVVRAAPVAAKAAAGPVSGAVPLTPIQHWFFEQAFTDSHHWNQAFMFELPAQLDLPALEVALHGLLRRHDALRLRYQPDAAGRWEQAYGADDSNLVLERVDLSALAADEQTTTIEIAAAAAQARFKLDAGCLVCALHFQLGAQVRGRLLLAVHHLVVDGVSWRVLREDLEALYCAAAAGVAAPLPERTSSLQAWSNALREHANSAAVQGSLAHWRAVAAQPALQLPHHATGQAAYAAEGRLITRLSPDETRALLQRLPAAFQTQINDALLTALARALQRSTGNAVLRIDLEGHGREHLVDGIDVSRTVGWFTTLFPIALELDPERSAVDSLLAVQRQLQQIPERGLGYGLLRYLSPDAAVRQSMVGTAAPVLFNYLGQFDNVVADSHLFSFARESTGPWRSPRAHRTHALEIVAVVRGGQLEIAWQHDADARHEPFIARLANDMTAGLQELIHQAQPGRSRPRTPAEFPLARLDAATLAPLTARFPQLEDIYPLTPMQRLFLAMESSQSNLGFEQWHFRLDGAVDATLLRQAMEQVMQRHSMLRTAFVAEGGAEPLQVVLAQANLPWSQEDWRACGAAEQSVRLSALLAADARAGFDLARAPLMRMALCQVANDSYHFIWSTHHLYIDGWSWPIVFGDLSRAYAALTAGSSSWPDEAVPYQRYVKWLADAAPQSEAFWKAQLAGFPGPTPFALSAPPGAIANTANTANTANSANTANAGQGAAAAAEVLVRLPAATTSALQALARGARVTLSAVFNGAWSLLLAHYSGAARVVFGAAFSGRPSEIEGIESMVGPCVNNLPLSFDVAHSDLLQPWLAQIQQHQFDVAQHQYAPLEQIQQWAGVAWRHRLFDSLVVFQNYQVDAAARSIGAAVRSTLVSAPEATNYALTLTVAVEQELRIRLICKSGAMALADAQQLAQNLETALTALAAADCATLGDVLQRLPLATRALASHVHAARTAVRRSVHAAPASAAEREVAKIWQELFGVEQVSLDDNFFDLGGHSLLLLRAHARLKASVRADLPIVALLQYPTVRALAHYLGGGAEADRLQAAGSTIDRAQKQREAQLRQRNLAKQRST